MAKVHAQSTRNSVVFENEIHNRFRDSVYKEQGKRGLGPYSDTHAPTFPAPGSFPNGQQGGVQLKRTRNLFEERVRFYLGRGASRKGHLQGISQGGLANVRRRSTAVSSRACADCKKIVLSLAGAALIILMCTVTICTVGSVWGFSSTRRTVLCMAASVLLFGPLVMTFHFLRKFCITPRLKWNEQHTFTSDVKICGVLLLLATLSGSFTSIYGRHLYNLANYKVLNVNSTVPLPNASYFGDELSSTVFAFDLSDNSLRDSNTNCQATALDIERYNGTSWTVFPYVEDFANAENTNVSYWLTFASSSHMDHWFVQDFISALPTSSEGVVYAIDYQYSEHDSGVLATAVSSAEKKCNLTRASDFAALTLVSSVDEMIRDWWTAVVLLHLACSILVPACVYAVYLVLKKCCSTTTVVILKD